ncbi:hypothetical protein [Paenibacillus arenosi]|uniref:Lipoprotein n=1 Tax=Paenibacillus arenosi TaxID=2774142 RepID=A0ABR9AWT7_9BACL|nr:hypothetical protein [Paenibacillus arenosi]MBD8498158.1 hypothetical protein [Paenibacillus arenosi]
MKRSLGTSLTIWLFIILVGCDLGSTATESKSQITYKENINKMQQFVMNEESYLFNDTDFTIYFPYAINTIENIQSVHLYMNNKLVQSIKNEHKFDIIDHNKLWIKTEGNNVNFNQIVIIDGFNNEIKLETGLFVFDGKDHTDQIPEDKQIYVMGSAFSQHGTKVTMKYELTRVNGAKVNFKVPDSLIGVISEPTTKLIEKKESSNLYEVTFNLNKTYYEQQHLYSINFEVICEQLIEGKKSSISKTLIPITIQDIQS